MKLEVFTNPPTKTEPVLRLKLVELNSYPGEITLIAVDEYGEMIPRGRILRVGPSGITTFAYVNEELGLPLNADRRVTIKGE